MSDEEKEALEILKAVGIKCKGICVDELIINLIEKQQKEIEEFKKKNETQPDCVEPVEKTEEMVNMRWVNHRFISKDKLKEILGIEETDTEKILSLLQTIVDENNRSFAITFRKGVTNEYK